MVLITRLPYVTFFSQAIQKIAPEYFTNGVPSLEAGTCIQLSRRLVASFDVGILHLPEVGKAVVVTRVRLHVCSQG